LGCSCGCFVGIDLLLLCYFNVKYVWIELDLVSLSCPLAFPTPSAVMVKPGTMAVASMLAGRSLNAFSRSNIVLSEMLTIAEELDF
jgi:hypothetical protein